MNENKIYRKWNFLGPHICKSVRGTSHLYVSKWNLTTTSSVIRNKVQGANPPGIARALARVRRSTFVASNIRTHAYVMVLKNTGGYAAHG